MSRSETQWAGPSTSWENKRRSSGLFTDQEEASAAALQPELLSGIQRAVEQERHRIAEDLHDGVAQDLALALHKLEHIQYLLEHSQLYQIFQEVTHINRILENGLQHLRDSIDALLPQQFDKQTAFASLPNLIREYQQEHPELQCEYRLEPQELLAYIPPELELLIFRFVQQALDNIWQHACASHIVLLLTLRSNILTVEVCDNGIGFSSQTDDARVETSAQLGLRIMRERIEQRGGSWEIKDQPGGGTCVRAVLPLEGA